jgi:choline dehydrogenase-like flavoprotein
MTVTTDSEVEDNELFRQFQISNFSSKLSEKKTLAPRPSLLGAGLFAHEVGTMPVHMDVPGPWRTNVQGPGVVDANLLVWQGFDNLYACDLSLLQSSPQANPTMTLAAISMRLADLFPFHELQQIYNHLR